MSNKFDDIFSDDPLGLLNVSATEKAPERTTSEKRLIESFEEINQFYEENNREPKVGSDIGEFMLASRLQGIRNNPTKVKTLLQFDFHNLLKVDESKSITVEDILGDDPMSLLVADEDDSIFNIKHVKAVNRIRPDYVSRRKKCVDFESYETLFQAVHDDLKNGRRKLVEFKEENLKEGKFFVLRGILLFLEKSDHKESKFEFESGTRVRNEGRTRCIFDNGTESTMLFRSLYKALLQDGFEVSDYQEMASQKAIDEEDKQNGYIYVLSSLSTNPQIRETSDLYKIGCCSGAVSERIKNASMEPTYLLSDVKVILTARCYNINVFQLEGAIHDFFSKSNVSFEVIDKLGNIHHPKEWFIAPLSIIEEAISLIVNDDITKYEYNPEMQLIVKKQN
ncbi:GIY-YIG nuclease family protein [Phascolarctobacterium succinatutens]|uniref:GIY-YIG nuclease family protein n=1 Tax=Phascolarctobacterium succinatutens TaxID=626940 RepID=UPI0026EB227A|nr:GIY-YIG nuclease family protein [Phascolarctobacterium succinatutens]